MGTPQIISDVRVFIETPRSDAFEDLALKIFTYQFRHNQPYRNLCNRRHCTPQSVHRWRDIPKVPASAFKRRALTTAPAVKVFRTSGTTQSGRGEHHLPDLSLYQASWRVPFQRALVPGGERVRILSLIPPEQEAPDSSLSWMVARAMDAYGTPQSLTVFNSHELEIQKFVGACEETVRSGEPVLILGTAFALAHTLDTLRDLGKEIGLPPGTRLMDTGGFKGRYREVSREGLLKGYWETFGIPETHVVGEYGMTEMCSQFYEDPQTRGFSEPLWVRTEVLDPFSLEPVAPGQTGLLAHFDLANAWTVCGIITEDLGMVDDHGIHLVGRASGSELRGCSLTTEEMLCG